MLNLSIIDAFLERFKLISHAGFDIDLKYITLIHASAPRGFPCYFARRELCGQYVGPSLSGLPAGVGPGSGVVRVNTAPPWGTSWLSIAPH